MESVIPAPRIGVGTGSTYTAEERAGGMEREASGTMTVSVSRSVCRVPELNAFLEFILCE